MIDKHRSRTAGKTPTESCRFARPGRRNFALKQHKLSANIVEDVARYDLTGRYFQIQ